MDSRRLSTGKGYTPNPNESSGNALGKHIVERLSPFAATYSGKASLGRGPSRLKSVVCCHHPFRQTGPASAMPTSALAQRITECFAVGTYTNRIQLLPVVALMVQQQLSPEQRREAEDVVIEAYMRWLDEGNLEIEEAGTVVTELAVLLLTYHRLLEVAELLVRRAWLSFHCGSGSRLARHALEALGQVEWHQSIEEECISLAIIQTVFPFLGEPLHMQEYADYPRLRAAFLAGELSLSETIERNTTHLLLLDAIKLLRFEQGQAIVGAYCGYLKARQIKIRNRKRD